MNLYKHQLYLLEQHSESFKSRSASIRIYTEGKSLIMKLGPKLIETTCTDPTVHILDLIVRILRMNTCCKS